MRGRLMEKRYKEGKCMSLVGMKAKKSGKSE